MEENLITLACKDLCVYIPIQKSILDSKKNHYRFQRVVQNVSCVAYPGEIIGIMGSTSELKSTFLRVLASRASSKVSVTGQIVVNGRESSKIMNMISCFVESHGTYFENLSVSAQLLYKARLSMDGRLGDYERQRRVNQVLNQIGIFQSKGCPIKYISEAQKVRMALAEEILTDLPIVFCEDPTLNLDAAEVNNFVKMLRNIASSDKIVIMTIQRIPTQALDNLDQIWLLAEGQLAFAGTPRSALNFFDKLNYACPKYFNVADSFLQTTAIHPGREQECKLQVRDICFSYNNTHFARDLLSRVDLEIERKPNEIRILNVKPPSSFLKVCWLVHRYFQNCYCSFSSNTYHLLQVIVVGVIIGLCFSQTQTQAQFEIQSIKGFLFVVLNASTLRNLLTTSIALNESLIFIREVKSGLYRTDTYMLSKFIFRLPIIALETLLLLSTSYFTAGLNQSVPTFSYTLLILFAAGTASYSFGFAISTIFSDSHLENAILILFHSFLMITSGAFDVVSSIPPSISWLRYISWMFYSYESLTILQLENTTQICDDYSFPCYETGLEFLEDGGLNPKNFNVDIILIILICLILNFISYLVLNVRSLKA